MDQRESQPNPAQQASDAAIVVRAAEILSEPYTDRENLAIRIARLEAARELTAAQVVSEPDATCVCGWGDAPHLREECSQPIEPQGAVVVSEYVRGLGATEAGIRLAAMLRGDVLLSDFTSTLTKIIEAALPVAVGAGEEYNYVAIANKAQEATGRSIFPSTVKAILEAARSFKVGAMEDTKRLDWLMHKISGSELRDIGVQTFDGCTREAIDAAMTPATPAGKGEES